MNWMRRRQNAEDRLKQEASLLPYQRPGWTRPILTPERKRRIDAQNRKLRARISPNFSATGD